MNLRYLERNAVQTCGEPEKLTEEAVPNQGSASWPEGPDEGRENLGETTTPEPFEA